MLRQRDSRLRSLLRRRASGRGWIMSLRDNDHAGSNHGSRPIFPEDDYACNGVFAAVGHRKIDAAEHLPHHICDRAVETTRYWFVLERLIEVLDFSRCFVQQAVQDFIERHAAHFHFDAGSVIAERKRVVCCRRDIGNNTGHGNDSTDGAPKPALPAFILSLAHTLACHCQGQSTVDVRGPATLNGVCRKRPPQVTFRIEPRAARMEGIAASKMYVAQIAGSFNQAMRSRHFFVELHLSQRG